jgi:hypothetical protein
VDLQEAQAKQGYEQQLLSLWQVELPYDGQGQNKDNDVRGNVAGRIDVPLQVRRDAAGVDGLVPEALDRVAQEDADKDLGYAPAAHDEGDGEEERAALLSEEDTIVLREEGRLEEEQRDHVEHDGDVKGTKVKRYQCLVKGAYVLPSAVPSVCGCKISLLNAEQRIDIETY